MENENIEIIDTQNEKTEIEDAGAVETTETEETIEVETETEVTYTQADLDKKVQSETDKVRTEYSKKVKELEAKIKELTPVEKTDAEKDYEKRLAELEARERDADMRDALKAKGISNELCKFLRDDVDVEELAGVLESIASDTIKDSAYKPGGHKSGDVMTKEEFKKLSMAEKEKLYQENIELYKTLARR